jgi:hypothetical protein
MRFTFPTPFRRALKAALAVLAVLAVSFTAADYALRGHLYYAKRVGNFVYQNTWQAVFPPSGQVRLFVRAAADGDYRDAHPDWRSRVPDLLAAAGRRFTDEFGIRLNFLGVEAWDRKDRASDYTTILARAEKSIDRKGAQILVVLIGRDPNPDDAGRWVDVGVAHYLGHALVLGDESKLVHELGHLFGAVDYAPGDPGYDDETIYSYRNAARTDRIDPANRSRILRNKHRLFW